MLINIVVRWSVDKALELHFFYLCLASAGENDENLCFGTSNGY